MPKGPLDSLLIVEVRSLSTDEVTTNQISNRTKQNDNQWKRDSLPSQSRTASTTGSDNRTQFKEPRITNDYTYLPHHENQSKSVIRYKDANNNQCEGDDALQNGETEYLNALLPPKTQEAQAIQNGTSVNVTKPNYDREHAHDVPYQENSTNLSSKQMSAAGSKMSCVSSTESSNSLNTQMTAEKLAQKTHEDKEENIKETESEGKAKQDSQDSVDEIFSRREVTSQLPENEPKPASSEDDMESASSVETKRSFENENEIKTEGEYEVDVEEGIVGSPKFKKFRAEQDDANSFQRTDLGNVHIDTFTASMKETLQIVGGKHERNNGPVKCFHCKQMFDNPTLLKVHAACHVLDKAFQCAFCGKKFTSTISHRTHLRIHTGEKPCTCKICGKSYRYSGHLTRHIRSHSGQRPHCCTICSKSFLSSGELCNHRRRHGNDKPFKCTQCQACFYFSRDLVTHRFTHANDTFNCPVCTVKFDDLTQMTEHIRTLHKMFRILVCKLCGKIFANPSRFKSTVMHIQARRGKDAPRRK